MQKQLLELWDKFAPALAQALEARMKDRTSGLQKKLAERADKEADDIQAILLELKKAIEAELNDPEYQQLTLFDDPEKEQFERNKDFLRTRSKAIPAEIERETAAIRARFADPQPRMFPVAVTFLVPEKIEEGDNHDERVCRLESTDVLFINVDRGRRGCIPTGYEMILRQWAQKELTSATFQDDFDLDSQPRQGCQYEASKRFWKCLQAAVKQAVHPWVRL